MRNRFYIMCFNISLGCMHLKKNYLRVFICLLLIDLLHILLSYKTYLWFHNTNAYIIEFTTLW